MKPCELLMLLLMELGYWADGAGIASSWIRGSPFPLLPLLCATAVASRARLGCQSITPIGLLMAGSEQLTVPVVTS